MGDSQELQFSEMFQFLSFSSYFKEDYCWTKNHVSPHNTVGPQWNVFSLNIHVSCQELWMLQWMILKLLYQSYYSPAQLLFILTNLKALHNFSPVTVKFEIQIYPSIYHASGVAVQAERSYHSSASSVTFHMHINNFH